MRRVVLLLALLAAPAFGDTAFYPLANPVRPNGMDLDRNGIVGEVGVDDIACDAEGETETGGVSIENLDHGIDGASEIQIYVDRSTGIDDSLCGTPGDPCATINHAVTVRKVDSAALGDNTFICVAGTSASVPAISDVDFDGEAGTYALTAAGRTNSNQRFDHELPENPTVIMGWDQDQDNEYPPFDGDDSFVWSTSGDSHFVCAPATCPSRVEFAHFSSDNAGQTSSTGGGFLQFSSGTPGAGRQDHWYLHDFEATDINGFQCKHSGNVAFSFQGQTDDLIVSTAYLSIGGGYIWRGGKIGTSNVYDRLFIHLYAIGGNSSALDNNGASCSSAGGNDKTSPSVGRTWANHSGQNGDFEYIDLAIVVDRSVGTDGYRDGLTGDSDISAGIILGGWRNWNFSGNYLQDLVLAAPSAHFDDGININQSSQNHYRENNTFRLTHSGAVNPGTITPLFANLRQGQGTGGGVRDEMGGDYHVIGNCQDTSGQPAYGYNSWILLEGSAGHDFTGADYRVRENRVQASFNFGRSLHHSAPNLSCGAGCVPSNHVFAENTFRSLDGASTTDDMWRNIRTSWSSVWSASSGSNLYYSDDFEDGGTSYSTLAAWQAVVNETGSIAGVNPAFSGCFQLSDGVDYAGSGGGTPPPSLESTRRLILKVQ